MEQRNIVSSRSPRYVTNNNLTWLQRQQMKLKEKKEMQLREKRQPYESNLMSELRSIQTRHLRPTASHRLDGYTSDTTAFADDDEDFTIPLHINTKNALSPSSTTSYSTTKSSYSTNGPTERPFVAVKRAHEQQFAKYREENYSTWRSNDVDSSSPHSASSRPQTPAFPVARTPYTNSSTPTVQFDLPGERLPPKSPTTIRRLSFPSSAVKNTKRLPDYSERKDRPISPTEFTNGTNDFYHTTIRNVSEGYSPKSPSFNGSSSPTVYQGNSRRSSVNSNNEPPQEVSPAHVKFVSDTSNYWYKPTISRDEAINMLRNKPPGTFVVRNSNTFPGGFGMALKVSTVPANVQNKDELVRHFLIEATSRGVRLKGCQNEPVFSSLSALVYQHSITQIALPCRLILPERDIAPSENNSNQTHMLLVQGAACNVLYLFSMDMESLTGPQAIKKAVTELLRMKDTPTSYVVHFKVNRQGITLTDNKRKLFFRKHYPINTVSHCGVDPDDRLWSAVTNTPSNRIFGFVARKPASSSDNQCHIFAELEPEQPATAIVNFVNKVLTTSGIKPNIV